MQNSGLRYSLCGIAGLFLLGLTQAGYAEALKQEQIKPYIQVKPVAGDESVVRVFFSPSCNYSKQYFNFFTNLSNTLPKDKRFEFSPVVNRKDGVIYSIAFLAVRRFYPNYVHNFIDASFVGVQERGMVTSTWGGIDLIGKASRLPVSLPRLVFQNQSILKKDLDNLIEVQHGLKITNTPSVAVEGTYIVTPEFTSGDSQVFSQLVNAVISMTE